MLLGLSHATRPAWGKGALFTMKWTPEQDRALRAVHTWLKSSSEQVFYLAGPAGTGKSTLAREAASGASGRVMYAAFTGKAALIMQRKGCHGAQTIHSLIYLSKDKSRTALREVELQIAHWEAQPESAERDEVLRRLNAVRKRELENHKRPSFGLNAESNLRFAKLLVIDECSMVDERMGEDLLSFGCKILVLGDRAQLPPVGGGGFFTKRRPDFELTEIHRQAKGSPVIELATAVREGRDISYGTYGTSRVVRKIEPQDSLEADQILVGRNKTRKVINARVRQLRGAESWEPVAGDKLVCLRNDKDHGFLNGGQWEVEQMIDILGDWAYLSVLSLDDDTVRRDTHCWTHEFRNEEVSMAPWEKREAQEFDYGYAMTCHKAQGSQWDNVVVFDQSSVFKESRRWLYTAITRAADRVTIVRG